MVSSSSSPALILQNNKSGSTAAAAQLVDNTESVQKVVVHPLVLLSILDHQSRRHFRDGRVIGTLLGKRDGDKVEVTNCYAVPHEEGGDEVAIGKDFNRQMLALHQRANRSEHVVGWYATSFPTPETSNNTTTPTPSPINPDNDHCIADTSSLIHEFYAGECDDTIVDSPIHLVVDTSLQNDSMGLHAYKSSPIMLKGEPLANMFHEISLGLKSSESERIVVDQMISANKTSASTTSNDDNNETEEEKQEMATPNSLHTSMEKLLSMLETVSSYVHNVVDQKVAPDDAVGRQIADTLSTVPRIRPEVFDKIFNDSLQDLLMVTYLSNITKTQLSIAEKLNETLDQNLKF